MRILFFTHYYPPESNAPASRTYEHCVRWARDGHDVTVVTCAPNCPSGVVFDGYRNRLRRQVEVVDGVRIVRVWTYLAPNAGTLRRILNYTTYMLSAIVASLRLPRPDVIVATSPQFFCGWAGVWASRLRRRPFVLEIRDIWPESIGTVGAIRNRPILNYLEWLERRLYRAADHIVAVGEGYRQKVLEKLGAPSRVSVVTNGVDLRQFEPRGPDELWLREQGLAGRFVCAYVGTIGMAHGLEVVIGAAQRLKALGRDDIRFCLVGDGAQREHLQRLVREAGVEDCVVFAGRQPKERMPAILASVDACLIHLRGCELFESVIPSKIFETMAMGTPMIMGVKGEAREIVAAAAAGLNMEPDSADDLATCVIRLSDDRRLQSELGSAAREFVERHYNRDGLARTMLETLIQVAGVESGPVGEAPMSHDSVLETVAR